MWWCITESRTRASGAGLGASGISLGARGVGLGASDVGLSLLRRSGDLGIRRTRQQEEGRREAPR